VQTGPVLHQAELGPDVAVLRDYAQTVQDLGYDFIVASDHVVGADPAAYPQLDRVFPIDTFLREPLTVFAFVSAVAPGLGFVSSVIILPQRQTVMVAKQAADLDTLCKGRLRLGVGIGWNPIEYEALGMGFEDRARRFEEQIDVLRRLWTERVVTFDGRFHHLHAAGINPRPIQQPIPIWIGASAEAAVKRAARIADGFLPLRPLSGGWQATMDKVWGWLEEFGRSRSDFGVEGRLDAGSGTPDEWRATYEMWRGFGASHLSISTAGLGTLAAHLDRLREVRDALDL
jgi:probable F420-dependent oxidoreductase